MSRRRILTALMWLWMAAVLAGGGVYFSANFSEVTHTLSRVSWLQIVICVGLLLSARLLLSEASRASLHLFGRSISLASALTMYSISQVGKYIPGSVWQFVGRLGLYKAEGIPLGTAAKALAAENIWLTGVATGLGVALLWPEVLSLAGFGAAFPSLVVRVTAAVTVMALCAATLLFGTVLAKGRSGDAVWLGLRAIALQSCAWVALGLSFWVLVPSADALGVSVAVGAFVLGWLAGYVMPLAPAGLGVREAAIAVLLAGHLQAEAAVVYLTLNRLIWTGLDFGLFFAYFRFGASARRASVTEGR